MLKIVVQTTKGNFTLPSLPAGKSGSLTEHTTLLTTEIVHFGCDEKDESCWVKVSKAGLTEEISTMRITHSTNYVTEKIFQKGETYQRSFNSRLGTCTLLFTCT